MVEKLKQNKSVTLKALKKVHVCKTDIYSYIQIMMTYMYNHNNDLVQSESESQNRWVQFKIDDDGC